MPIASSGSPAVVPVRSAFFKKHLLDHRINVYLYTEMQLGHGMSNPEEIVHTAEDFVFGRLRKLILSGDIPAGSAIRQAEIAARLRVSRIPVRDAMRRLESIGLVVTLPNRRTVVPSFTALEIREIFEMRAVLEGLLARWAVVNLTETDIAELAALSSVMRSVRDLDVYMSRHELFHDLVAQRAGLPRVRREAGRLREIVTPYIRIYGTAHHTAELSADRHDDLLAVLKAGHPAAAEKAFASHVRHSGQQFEAAMLALTKGRDKTLPDGDKKADIRRGGARAAGAR